MIRLKNAKIIDFHCHFPAIRPGQRREPHPRIREYERERADRMALEWDHGEAEPWTTNEADEPALAERWAREVERYELGRVVFVTGSSDENLSKVVRRYPDKFSGLVALRDPARPDALEQLRRGIEELGLSGIKMLGPLVDVPWDDERLKAIWRYAADKKLPVLIHFGLLGRGGGVVWARNINPLTFYPVAREYADLNLVVPHFGCGYMGELLQLMWSCPNVYVDTSGSNQWMRWLPYPMDLDIAFRKFYETVGPKRIVFGTDSSWFPRGFSYRYLQDQMRSVRYLNFPEADIEDIFSNNAARLLHLPRE